MSNEITTKLSVIFDIREFEKLNRIIQKIENILEKYPNKKLFEPSLRKIFNCSSINYSLEDLDIFKRVNKKWSTNENLFRIPHNYYKQYCVGGRNLLIINADLTFASSYCNLFPSVNIPFVFLTPDQIFKKLQTVVKCRHKNCLIPTNWVLPKFQTRFDAFQFLTSGGDSDYSTGIN